MFAYLALQAQAYYYYLRRRELKGTGNPDGNKAKLIEYKLKFEEVRSRITVLRCLGSIANDLDIVLDWVFISDLYMDSERLGLKQGPIFIIAFVFALMGSLLWILLTFTFILPFLRTCLNNRNLEFTEYLPAWAIPLANICLEDLPQTTITIYVSVIWEKSATPRYAYLNIATSFYAILIKMVELLESADETTLQKELKMIETAPVLMEEAYRLQSQGRANDRALEQIIKFASSTGTYLALSSNEGGTGLRRLMFPGSFDQVKLADVPFILLESLNNENGYLVTQNKRNEIGQGNTNPNFHQIQTLNLNNNRIPKQAIKNVLVTDVLLKLGLKNNKINDEDVSHFCEALRYKALKVLDLSGNNITTNGAEKIIESLRINNLFQELYLADNKALGNHQKLLTMDDIKEAIGLDEK